jgi:hypothetical protein
MDWKIISKKIDTAELSQTDHQDIFLVYVKDGAGNNIEAAEAYGIEHRTEVTKAFVLKYQDQGIDKIEHED